MSEKSNRKIAENLVDEVFDFNTTAYLAGAKAVVIMSDSRDMIGDAGTPYSYVTDPKTKASIQFVSRGQNNQLPIEIMDKVNANVTVASNVEFNAKMAYGDGILVMKKVKDPVTKKVTLEEQLPSEQEEIYKFLEDNNYTNSIQEWCNDLTVFFDSYAEIILEEGSTKVASIKPIESINSRLSLVNPKTYKIDYHGYSIKWKVGQVDDIDITPLLDRHIPILDLKRRIGMEVDPETKKKNTASKDKRFMMQLMMPTPGRYYNGKPYWWSIFESGWYDFACAIPTFKKALLKNQMVIKYQIMISEQFYPKLFKNEGITDPTKQIARKKKFLKDMNDFLSGEQNTGKSFVSEFQYDKVKGFEVKDIIIQPIDNAFKGGEYVEDSEEVTSILCYAMGVHPSVVGAVPGKGKSISGTEARELFIIKQSMMKPIRDLLVQPLYVAKALNGWDPDVYFVIPNIMLTTVDHGTGAIKSVGNQKV